MERKTKPSVGSREPIRRIDHESAKRPPVQTVPDESDGHGAFLDG